MAVLEPLQDLARTQNIHVHYVALDPMGRINYHHLEKLLQQHKPALVSLMHGNNELGNLNDLLKIGTLCRQYQAIFHTDAVQTLGNYELDLSQFPVDILVGSAHKFHGPKGIGVVYINNRLSIHPQILGGAQERAMRAGTENVPAIVGLGQALFIAHRDMDANRKHIERIKRHMIQSLQASIANIDFYGTSAQLGESLYTLLSVKLPYFEAQDMLLFNLDIHHIAASSGSACTSGSQKKSHVMEALYPTEKSIAIRFSFSKYNTIEEIDYVIARLTEIYHQF